MVEVAPKNDRRRRGGRRYSGGNFSATSAEPSSSSSSSSVGESREIASVAEKPRSGENEKATVVLMQRLSYPTETVSSKKITKNTIAIVLGNH